MNAPTENAFPPCSVGIGIEGGGGTLGKLAVLDRPIEWMRDCQICNLKQCFVAVLECRIGLIGFCSGCSNEDLAEFTRAISEVAS